MSRAAFLLVALAGCAGRAWEGRISRWGTLREVLRDGDTRGRIRLDLPTGKGAVGLGALEDLAGEVTIVDGRIWISRADRGEVARSSAPRSGDEAAFLVLAEVPGWQDRPVEEPVNLVRLEIWLAGIAGGRETFPFIVEGEFVELDAHVLNGACPFASDPERRGEPVRFRRERARGRLVGFFTTAAPGTITHHGSRIHAHAVLDDGPVAGHVDRASIRGTLRVPAD